MGELPGVGTRCFQREMCFPHATGTEEGEEATVRIGNQFRQLCHLGFTSNERRVRIGPIEQRRPLSRPFLFKLSRLDLLIEGGCFGRGLYAQFLSQDTAAGFVLRQRSTTLT
jgi:hypothetical protein